MALAKKSAPAAKPVKAKAPEKSKSSAKPAAKPAAAKGAKAAKSAAPATVTLKHLAGALAEKHATPKKQAETMLTDMVDLMVTHLKGGDRLRIGGFGIIQVKDRPARMGRNPATGAAIEIKASKKVGFRPAKELKEAI